MEDLEVGDARLVARLDECLEAGLHQGRQAAAQDRLLAEEVRLGLLLEGGLDDAGAAAADADAPRQGQVRALPVSFFSTATMQGTPLPSWKQLRTVWPGPLGRSLSRPRPLAGRSA